MTYFHPILGPDVILTAPDNTLDNLDKDFVDSIKNIIGEPNLYISNNDDFSVEIQTYKKELQALEERKKVLIEQTSVTMESSENCKARLDAIFQPINTTY